MNPDKASSHIPRPRVPSGAPCAANGQSGYMMLLVPAILVAMVFAGMQMRSRAATAMSMSGSDLNFIQTQLCTQQCGALAVNEAAATLEANKEIVPGSYTCPCRTDDAHYRETCANEIGQVGFRSDIGCYEVRTEVATLPVSSTCKDAAGRTSTLQEDAELSEIPIFQFGVFFENLLEFENYPPLNMTGKVHSNDTILLRPHFTLRFHDWVTSPGVILVSPKDVGNKWNQGEIHFGLKDGSGPDASGIKARLAFPGEPLENLIGDFDEWKKTHLVAYGNEGNDCDPPARLSLPFNKGIDNHDLIDWRNPSGDGYQVRRQKFAWRASLIYKNSWRNRNQGAAALGPDPIRPPAAPVFAAADIPGRVTYWEPRDSVDLKLIPIDIALLQQRPGDSIIYLYDSLPAPGGGGAMAGGFLLHNGAKLTRPLTIVTNTRMVLLGDFNTSADYSLPSGGKSVFPAALISDCMVHLSSEFRPTEHMPGSLVDGGYGSVISDRRPGYRLTLNGCVMTGLVNIGGTQFDQGGFNNLVRMCENWGTAEYWKHGASAALWYSRHSNRPHRGFQAPVRFFGFDPMYNDMRNMPPGTPRLVSPYLADWNRVRI